MSRIILRDRMGGQLTAIVDAPTDNLTVVIHDGKAFIFLSIAKNEDITAGTVERLPVFVETDHAYVTKVETININKIRDIVESWPWHGSWFPEEQCYAALKNRVSADKHDELKNIISQWAKTYNSHLE